MLRSTRKYYPSTVPYYSILQSAAPVLLCTTQYCSSTTLYYKVFLRMTKYYSTLQSTTPLLLCTTKNYPLYYEVLQSIASATPVLESIANYYSVLQCTYSAPQRATKYYFSTILYYKVLLCTTPLLLPYFSVLQKYYSGTTPTAVLLCPTKCYSSTTLYYKVLQSTTKHYSSDSLYYKVLLQSAIPNTARATKGDSPKSPNAAPATKVTLCNITKCCACLEK